MDKKITLISSLVFVTIIAIFFALFNTQLITTFNKLSLYSDSELSISHEQGKVEGVNDEENYIQTINALKKEVAELTIELNAIIENNNLNLANINDLKLKINDLRDKIEKASNDNYINNQIQELQKNVDELKIKINEEQNLYKYVARFDLGNFYFKSENPEDGFKVLYSTKFVKVNETKQILPATTPISKDIEILEWEITLPNGTIQRQKPNTVLKATSMGLYTITPIYQIKTN